MTEDQYEDSTLSVNADTLTIRGYYFPWFGAKRVPLSSIRIVTRLPLTTWGGRWRIWGSTTLQYWANLDVRRTRKDTAFTVDIGASIMPFITPERPDQFERVLRAAVPAVPFVVKS
ncbi:hypothetical protein [Tessaracoccus antarcticus]|uniref:PH domain-containing protein n=1 Tax=Tessaracoccus antarcticus TaxID=2479848 RepID=A0A3M0GCT5_9ACTN|nr:hypothetical protein [Tessaracoccus antarcticus]RMB58939.1 hypothetical protein EAX62_12605 [Tessaracoccus antarcticus]